MLLQMWDVNTFYST